MRHYTTDTGEQAWAKWTYPLARKTHLCHHDGCPFGQQINPDTCYTRLTIIIEGQGLYTETYHDLCAQWEYN